MATHDHVLQLNTISHNVRGGRVMCVCVCVCVCATLCSSTVCVRECVDRFETRKG
jgi:hypothetical protein